MRIASAILVLAAAVVGAFVLRGYRVTHHIPGTCIQPGGGTLPCGSVKRRPGWVDPAALGIVFAGIAGAALVMAARRGE